MKKSAIALTALLFLVSCGSSKPSVNLAYKVPDDCNQQVVIDAFAQAIPGAKYVPTDWKPAAGTDLKAVIDSGGIACTYGIQKSEIGGTVMWALNSNGLWEAQVKKWKSAKYVQVDIPNLDESDAYMLPEGSTGADGMHIWQVNILAGNIWIQLGGGFIQSMNQALPLIKAAVAAAS